MPEPTSDIVGKFDEALEYFRKRVPMPAEQFYALQAQAREKAFTVSGTAQADVIQDVLTSIERALEEGQDLKSWKLEIGYALRHAWAGTVKNPGWRLETIYRTNVQTAFSHGRVRQMRAPEVVALRPYWRLNVTEDGRESDICHSLIGTLMPANDPRWKGRIPPLHHACRTILETLRRSQAERSGGVKPPPDDVGADDGFGEGPSDDPNVQVEPFQPVRKYDPTLAAIKERKDAAEAPKPPRQPPAKPEHSPDHWVEEFRRKGYPEGTAKAIAIGRAAEERGLDLPMADVRAIVKRLEDSGVYLYSTGPSSSDSKSLREYLAGRTESFGIHQARSLAALASHADSVDRRAIPLKMPGRPRGEGEKFDDRRGWYDKTVAFYTALTHRGLRHPDKESGYSIRWGVARGYHKPAGRKPGRIALSDSDSVFAHEWAHALEALNPRLLDRSREFLQTRTKGEPLKRLGGRYGPREKARADGFYEAYVGKDYSRGGRVTATEILSMGLEKIATGQGWWLLRADPEHFYFCLGQLFG